MQAPTDATPLAPPSGPCLTFDPLLVGRVVDLELARLAAPVKGRLERERQLARELPATYRAAVVRAVDRITFQELGHEAAVARGLGARTLRYGSLRLEVRLALDGRDEGLFIVAARPSLRATVFLLPSRFVDGTLRQTLLPLLERLEEALDPGFEWRPDEPGGPALAERIEELWSAHAALMLGSRGLPGPSEDEIRKHLVAILPSTPRDDVDELVRALARTDLTYPELLGMARAQDRLAAVALALMEARAC